MRIKPGVAMAKHSGDLDMSLGGGWKIQVTDGTFLHRLPFWDGFQVFAGKSVGSDDHASMEVWLGGPDIHNLAEASETPSEFAEDLLRMVKERFWESARSLREESPDG